MRGLKVAALLLLALAGSGCAGTIRAQVLDADTRQPIPGAVVLGVWSGTAGLPGLHHSNVVDVKESETDGDGRFQLQRPNMHYVDEEAVTVYKLGYTAWSNLFTFPNSVSRASTRIPARIILEKFPAGASHQKHVDFISGATRSQDTPTRAPKFSDAERPEQLMR